MTLFFCSISYWQWVLKLRSLLNNRQLFANLWEIFTIISNIHNIIRPVTCWCFTKFQQLRKDHFQISILPQFPCNELNWCPILTCVEVCTACGNEAFWWAMNQYGALPWYASCQHLIDTARTTVLQTSLPTRWWTESSLHNKVEVKHALTPTHSWTLRWKI